MSAYLIVKKFYSHPKKKEYAHVKMYVYFLLKKVYSRAKKKSYGEEILFTQEEKNICTCINLRVFTSEETYSHAKKKVYAHV